MKLEDARSSFMALMHSWLSNESALPASLETLDYTDLSFWAAIEGHHSLLLEIQAEVGRAQVMRWFNEELQERIRERKRSEI